MIEIVLGHKYYIKYYFYTLKQKNILNGPGQTLISS